MRERRHRIRPAEGADFDPLRMCSLRHDYHEHAPLQLGQLEALDEARMKSDTMSRASRFDCGPGDGAYIPSTTPHMTESGREWVTPGDELTISMGMVFYTDVTRRYAHNYALNWQLPPPGIL